MSGVTTSSVSLAWSLRNWVILDYQEANVNSTKISFSFFFSFIFFSFLSYYSFIIYWDYRLPLVSWFLCFLSFLYGFIILHLFYLHFLSSNNPLRNSTNNKIPFFPFIFHKDFFGFILILCLYLLQTHFGISSFFNKILVCKSKNFGSWVYQLMIEKKKM